MSIQVKGNLLDLRPLIIFDYGDLREEVTGGWTLGSYASFAPDNIYVSVPHSSSSSRRSYTYTNNKIDVTKYKTLEVIMSNNANNPWDGPSVGLATAADQSPAVSAGPGDAAHQEPTVFTADISDLTGLYYPMIYVHNSTSSSSGYTPWVRVYSFRLLK